MWAWQLLSPIFLWQIENRNGTINIMSWGYKNSFYGKHRKGKADGCYGGNKYISYRM